MYNYFVLIIGYLKFKQRNSMKNLYILQTDKPNPNILLKKDDGTLQIFDTDIYNMWEFHQQFGDFSPRNATYQNIYITSDEEIKEGDWCINIYRDKNEIFKNINLESTKFVKKIILTTDQDLIKEGIQAIDDEFLEWFIKNSSCEEIKFIKRGLYVGSKCLKCGFLENHDDVNTESCPNCGNSTYEHLYNYKIIIPKEEFKEINVYVISNEQPFENWFGTLKSYDFITNKCIVENNKEENIELFLKEVQEADTNKSLKEFLLEKINKENVITFLTKSNLSINEAELFYTLSCKIQPPQKEIESFYTEMENGIPFEGGMGTTEAIVGLTESI